MNLVHQRPHPHVVVDIGNTRIKWGLVSRCGSQVVSTVSLGDESDTWARQWELWLARPELAAVPPPRRWVLASVHPRRCDELHDWLEARGEQGELVLNAAQLPLEIAVPRPDHVGIDRLLDAVAAKAFLRGQSRFTKTSGQAGQSVQVLGKQDQPRAAVLIDAGSAVTVDWLDEHHIFRGGAIFPGLRLMAEALHSYTALLPLVQVREPIPELPATATAPAMQVGIYLATVGGIREAVLRYDRLTSTQSLVFLTGGDAEVLAAALDLGERLVSWPNQTLEGILCSVSTRTA